MDKEIDYKWLAFRDVLTKTYNRNYYEYEFQNIFEEGILFFIDMDSLKEINDTKGHTAGDKSLIDFAESLKDIFGDNVIRIGGDEFVTFCLKFSEKEKSLIMLQDKFKFSYGFVFKQKNDNLKEMLEKAEILMYKMKNDKKIKK